MSEVLERHNLPETDLRINKSLNRPKTGKQTNKQKTKLVIKSHKEKFSLRRSHC